MYNTGTIYGINGPVIYLKGNTGFKMSEMVYVGKQKLVGEVIALDKDLTTIQSAALNPCPALKLGRPNSRFPAATTCTAAPLSQKFRRPVPSRTNAWFHRILRELW